MQRKFLWMPAFLASLLAVGQNPSSSGSNQKDSSAQATSEQRRQYPTNERQLRKEQAIQLAPSRTVTLRPPLDPVTKKYDEGKACFSFKLGMLKETVLKETKKNDWDLGYGFVAISGEDWFRLHFAARSVMQDLGELDWDNPGTIPALEPLPPVPDGERRQVTIDASGDTHKEWAKTTRSFAKVILGHMYVLRVKYDASDFYVLFRVEEFEQNKRCTISWRVIPPPEVEESL
jgi:hypothetical protein